MTPVLEARSLGKSFGGLTAVNAVSFAVAAGDSLAIIGPNGAGKSTLLNLLSGLLPPSSGDVLVNGASVIGLRPNQIRGRGVARTFQNGRLFKRLTVLDNVMSGAVPGEGARLWQVLFGRQRYDAWQSEVRDRALSALDVLGLTAHAERDAGDLPFGLQRNVEIARALAADAEVLLLDEPAAGLNAAERSALLATLAVLKQRGLAVVLIEHDMSMVMAWSERIVVLNFGEKIAEGAPAAIRTDARVIEAYLGSGAGDA